MSKFRKKPVVIEAVRFLAVEDSLPHFDVPLARDVPEWMTAALAGPHGYPHSAWTSPVNNGDGYKGQWNLSIGTLEGIHYASPGDWIIRGVQGEIYPCKPEIFEATYEQVEAA